MSIFTHVTLGTNDLEKANRFYTDVLSPLGVSNLGNMSETSIAFGVDHPELAVLKPRDGKPANFGNGGTVGFRAPNRQAVDQFHAAGLANGGSDEGAPGPRKFAPNAYAAYLRDPDGNKICAYSFSEE